MKSLIRWSLMICALIITVACASSPNRESTGQYLDSAAITAKVKTNLINELGTKGFSITVKTFKDEVQLSGFVGSERIKRHAGQIAADLEGVRRVRNDLLVR